jgi:hypothetical protein
MQFRGVKAVQVTGAGPAQRPELVDRGCPPATARARSIWHAGGTADKNDDDSYLVPHHATLALLMMALSHLSWALRFRQAMYRRIMLACSLCDT